MYGNRGVVLDRNLTAVEARTFRVLADLYRDADVLVVAPANPVCATGLTAAQARAIARGTVTDWSQVGGAAGPIRVRHLTDGFGDAVPHLGTTFVTRTARVNYAPGAVGAIDGGVSAVRGGDVSVAAVTTWSRVRTQTSAVCVVPPGGVAATDVSVANLTFPEAFPVRYVVTKALVGRTALDRGHTAVMRRAMATHLKSPRLRGMLRSRGVLVTGDPVAPAA